jgi:anti-anti-sigma factor
LVRVTGDLDASDAPRLDEMLGLLDGPLVVDCSRLAFIDAAGLEVLAQAAHEHDGLTLRHVTPMLARLVEVAGLAHVLHVDDSTSD